MYPEQVVKTLTAQYLKVGYSLLIGDSFQEMWQRVTLLILRVNLAEIHALKIHLYVRMTQFLALKFELHIPFQQKEKVYKEQCYLPNWIWLLAIWGIPIINITESVQYSFIVGNHLQVDNPEHRDSLSNRERRIRNQ